MPVSDSERSEECSGWKIAGNRRGRQGRCRPPPCDRTCDGVNAAGTLAGGPASAVGHVGAWHCMPLGRLRSEQLRLGLDWRIRFD